MRSVVLSVSLQNKALVVCFNFYKHSVLELLLNLLIWLNAQTTTLLH